MVFHADFLVSLGKPRITFGTGFNPTSLTQPKTFIVSSGEIPFFMASKTCCELDSTPNQTEMQPASFILRRSSFVSISTRVPQFHFSFNPRFLISLHNSLVLACSPVNASSQNVNCSTL